MDWKEEQKELGKSKLNLIPESFLKVFALPEYSS